MSDFSLTLEAPGHFLHTDWEETILEVLHANADELGQLEQQSIRDRTNRETGALKLAEKYDLFTDPHDPNLVFLYADEAEQLAEWNRVYVQYQEGGTLGLPTYTNPPHEMFAQVLTTDQLQIELWCAETLAKAFEIIADGLGAELAGQGF